MKKLSKMHIEACGNRFLEAMISVSKGERVIERDGEKLMSVPLPNLSLAKKSICQNLERLCKNVIEIEINDRVTK